MKERDCMYQYCELRRLYLEFFFLVGYFAFPYAYLQFHLQIKIVRELCLWFLLTYKCFLNQESDECELLFI